MIIRAISEHPDTQIVVQHTAGLEDGGAQDGVEIPEGAHLISIVIPRLAKLKQQTVHIVFEPHWPTDARWKLPPPPSG